MDGDAEVGRELERLRAELMEFVVDALAERTANGEQPTLNAALVDAIDRRVDEAVSARISQAQWPDPHAFADSVIAAASGSAGSGERLRSAGRRETGGGARSRGADRKRAMTAFGLGMLTALGIAVVAFFVYSAMSRPPAVQTNVLTPLVNGVEPTSAGPVNVIVERNAAAPGNQQGQTP